jgi:hypothetical protein
VNLTAPKKIVYTFTVWTPKATQPFQGNTYRDKAGHLWTLISVRRSLLFDGPPNQDPYDIELRSEHGAYRIEDGGILYPVSQRISGEGWGGLIEHQEGQAFGNVRRKPLGSYQSVESVSPAWSWLYREIGEKWEFMVGPYTEHLNGFRDPVFNRIEENRQPLVEGERLSRIQRCVEAFQGSL